MTQVSLWSPHVPYISDGYGIGEEKHEQRFRQSTKFTLKIIFKKENVDQ